MRWLSALPCLAALLLPPTANASSVTGAHITRVYPVSTGNLLYFDVDGTRTTAPTCATQNRWVVDVSTPAGQVIAATVLTAISQRKTVSVYGGNACPIDVTTESVSLLLMDA